MLMQFNAVPIVQNAAELAATSESLTQLNYLWTVMRMFLLFCTKKATHYTAVQCRASYYLISRD